MASATKDRATDQNAAQNAPFSGAHDENQVPAQSRKCTKADELIAFIRSRADRQKKVTEKDS